MKKFVLSKSGIATPCKKSVLDSKLTDMHFFTQPFVEVGLV